jgi:hypothetical protein
MRITQTLLKADMGSRLQKTALVVLAIACCLATGPTATFADTVSLSPQKDNSFTRILPVNSATVRAFISTAGKTANPLRRGLIAFDLTANMIITDATLSMFLSIPHAQTATINISLSKALHDWG